MTAKKRTRPLSSSNVARRNAAVQGARTREARADAALAAAKAALTAPAARYEVTVRRDSITRATHLDAVSARHTVHTAVQMGHPVSCRQLAADEPTRPGVWEVQS